jgi:PhnB protein
MSDAWKPDGWSTITPRIVTPDVEGLVTFVQTVFDAEGVFVSGRPSQLKIDESMIMVSDGGGTRPAMSAFLHLYVRNADQTYARAIAAGAHAIEAPTAMPWGDRRAMFADWGNLWQIATFQNLATPT